MYKKKKEKKTKIYIFKHGSKSRNRYN